LKSHLAALKSSISNINLRDNCKRLIGNFVFPSNVPEEFIVYGVFCLNAALCKSAIV